MSNVKPGDRAIVVKSKSGNVGKVVSVIGPWTKKSIETSAGPCLWADFGEAGVVWECESLGSPFRSAVYDMHGKALPSDGVTAVVAPFFDDQLRRLDPDIDTPVEDSQSVVQEIES